MSEQTDKIDDGGPAYPAINGMPHDEHGIMRPTYLSTGMTLRDYFAAKAMQALIADTNNHDDWMQDQEYCAAVAYGYADAMLKARKTPSK